VSIVFPVFTVIAIGYLYGRKHRPDMIATNQVNMGIFVPALLFSALAGKSVNLADVQMIALGGFVIVLGSGLLGWPIARWLGYAPTALLPPMTFKNAGNMGLPLPLPLFAFGEAVLAATNILLVFGALPPAVLNFMFAERYVQEPEKVASIVILGNLVALLSISLALAFSLAA
jgi:predicted permease